MGFVSTIHSFHCFSILWYKYITISTKNLSIVKIFHILCGHNKLWYIQNDELDDGDRLRIYLFRDSFITFEILINFTYILPSNEYIHYILYINIFPTRTIFFLDLHLPLIIIYKQENSFETFSCFKNKMKKSRLQVKPRHSLGVTLWNIVRKSYSYV